MLILIASVSIFIPQLANARDIAVSDITFSKFNGARRMDISLSERTNPHIFYLKKKDKYPPRLVIDLPIVIWNFDIGMLSPDSADAQRVRTGIFKEKTTRIVIDLVQEHTLGGHSIRKEGEVFVLSVYYSLEHDTPEKITTENTTTSTTISGIDKLKSYAPNASSLPIFLRSANEEAPIFSPLPFPQDNLVVVVLDPGHGGKDPGAAYRRLREKDITLQFAKILRETFITAGGYRVYLTRSDDRFLYLHERVKIAKKHKADIFFSIHADSAGSSAASGASVYTLSEKASDAEAERLAENANASDMLEDFEFKNEALDIRRILIDLAQRESLNESSVLANFIITELRKKVRVLKRRPKRQANFRVLKILDTPATLIELGFLTNKTDRSRLQTHRWRKNTALAIVEAVNQWGSRATP
jgi:N-acetylmuramoyl-L-alanine amidase